MNTRTKPNFLRKSAYLFIDKRSFLLPTCTHLDYPFLSGVGTLLSILNVSEILLLCLVYNQLNYLKKLLSEFHPTPARSLSKRKPLYRF